MGQRNTKSISVYDNSDSKSTLHLPPSLVHEAKALKQLEDCEDGPDDHFFRFRTAGIGITQAALDIAAHSMEGGDADTLTDQQWLAVANVACWLDIKPLEQAVVRRYRNLFAQDPAVVSRMHTGIGDLHKRVDVPLAKRVVSDTVRSGKDVRMLARGDNVWKVTSLGGHSKVVTALAVLPDGRLASGSADTTIKLWETITNTCTATLTGHLNDVNALVVLLDGRLASGSVDKSIKLWNTCTNTCTATLTGHFRAVYSLAVLADGRLASGSADHSIKLWNTCTSKCTATLTGHLEAVYCLAVLTDGRLASGSFDQSIKLWNTVTSTCTATLIGHSGHVFALTVMPNGHLASGSVDCSVKLWNTATSECTATLIGHAGPVCALAVIRDGRIACGSVACQIILWDPATNACTTILTNTQDYFPSLSVLLDGRLASASHGNSIAMWDTATGLQTDTLSGHTGGVSSIAALSNGRIAVACRDKSVRVWSLVTFACEAVLVGCTHRALALAGLSDCRLACGCDCAVLLWDFETNWHTELVGHTQCVLALAALPGGLLASGSLDGTVRVWNTVSLTTVRVLECTYGVLCLAVLSDGYLAAKVSNLGGGQVKVWSTDTYERVNRLDCVLFGAFVSVSAGETFATWTKRHKKVDVQATFAAGLPDGRTVQIVCGNTVQVPGVTSIDIPYAQEQPIVSDTGRVVISGQSGVIVLQEAPSRANVFLALTAIGLPAPYILEVMS